MSPFIVRLIGIVFLIAAAIIAILNLHRVADLRMPGLVPVFMIVGIAFVIVSRRKA
jgi:hypothetical protein